MVKVEGWVGWGTFCHCWRGGIVVGVGMGMPTPENTDPEQLRDIARETMKEAKFPMLASIDGEQPRVRPVSPVRTVGFEVWVASLRRYGKTEEIAANPRVELVYLSPRHDQVRISGVAQVVSEPGVIGEIFEENPLLRGYLGSADNPELVLYRIEPLRVRFMREWALEYLEVELGQPGR